MASGLCEATPRVDLPDPPGGAVPTRSACCRACKRVYSLRATVSCPDGPQKASRAVCRREFFAKSRSEYDAPGSTSDRARGPAGGLRWDLTPMHEHKLPRRILLNIKGVLDELAE